MNIDMILIANCNFLENSARNNEQTQITNANPVSILNCVAGIVRFSDGDLNRNHASKTRTVIPTNAAIIERL
jgi:hypothetical protein